ncbi:MAG: hypothetical protein Q9225_004141 [Loekoesia sp. 1 TL-2023]
MARVHAKRIAAPVRTGASVHAKTNEQRKPSYKVIIEEMTEKKKKLHTTSGNVHYEQDPGHHPTRRSKRSTQHTQPKGKQNAKPRAASVGSDMDQSEIDARAAFAIRDLFPKIPDEDVRHIVAQAFQKVRRPLQRREGKSRVGTAVDQPLLKSHSYLDARAIVQPYTLDKIIEWRDEKDEPDAVEDILREVIVISDDEDEASDDDAITDRESSVEVISSHEIANNVQVQPLDYSTLDDKSQLERPGSPEDAWAPSVKFIRRLSTPPPEPARRRQGWVDRQQAHRNRVWQEAISRRRNMTHAAPSDSIKLASHPYNRVEIVSPPQRHPQQTDTDRKECEAWARLTESRPLHANSGIDRYSFGGPHRRWDHENKDDQFMGSRFVELHDDPMSPAQKRRRVTNDVVLSSKVMYQPLRDQKPPLSVPFGSDHNNGQLRPDPRPNSLVPPKKLQYDQGASRPMELVPVTGRVHHVAGNEPCDDVSQNDNRVIAQETHATNASPGMRFEDKQQVYSPLFHSQSRYPEGFPIYPESHSFVSGFMPSSAIHEPSRTSRPHYANSSSSHANLRFDIGVKQTDRSRDHGFQEVPIRLKPLEANKHSVMRYTQVEPVFDHAREARGDIPSSGAGLPKYTLQPPHQSYEHHNAMAQPSRPPKLDCPKGAQGSFCNRVGEKGFTKRDHLDEHLRKVHLMDLPIRYEKNQMLEDTVTRAAPRRDPSAQSSYIYAKENHAETPRDLQRTGYDRIDRDQKVVYISSSPLMGER